MFIYFQEETLEAILFGDADASAEPSSGDAPNMVSVPALVEEIERLNKNLQHARELLSETEATNATLVDQVSPEFTTMCCIAVQKSTFPLPLLLL